MGAPTLTTFPSTRAFGRVPRPTEHRNDIASNRPVNAHVSEHCDHIVVSLSCITKKHRAEHRHGVSAHRSIRAHIAEQRDDVVRLISRRQNRFAPPLGDGPVPCPRRQ
ncbi:MAG: hypothetical protein QM760_03500 [Nibricoccus sp.]